ncbi:MAG TPA: RlmE family RNA methyltransferase [Methanoregulaceae archaeon]|nr:RlmE family RNA methyltransferase [Methanoregulaceae archaeon]HOV67727.1 RlmE family RNA methyltransferase [Methanoregulaceae archaeon]HQJ87157.1 RlmE family RNA methyltransferase [Methanoregulaceae archaeon]
MGSQWGEDRQYRAAVREGYRSRAAYKLIEVQKHAKIIRPDDNVVDLGAAPGSWLQVLRSLTTGKVIGVDLNPIAPIDGVETVVGDLNDPAVRERVRSTLGVVNVVVSDAAPKLSGQRSYDQARAIELDEQVLAFARATLKPGGNFLVKSFQGEDFPAFLARVRQVFRSVRTYQAKASRRGSRECYVIGKNFVGGAPDAD